MAAELDLVNRDPNGINANLQVAYEDVLAEPDGIHSPDCLWKLSFTCFNLWKRLCYTIFTAVFGIFIACYWGCEFAYIAFYQVWILTPTLKLFEISCSNIQRIWSTIVSCCMDPLCTSCGNFFHAFRK